MKTGTGSILALLLSLCAGMSAHATTGSLITASGTTRSWLKFAPATLDEKPSTVVFVLHGGGGSGKAVQRGFSFNKLADKHRFLVIYPNGLERHWNDGREGGSVKLFKGDKPNDVAFLVQLARHLIAIGKADPTQIYVVGVSNGGMMSQRLLCEASEVFAAGASIIANLPTTLSGCEPQSPRSFLLINGDADPLMPWLGGGVGFRHKRGEVVSSMDSFIYWQQVNQCTGPVLRTNIPDQNVLDGSTAQSLVASGCSSTNQVEMIQIVDGGHTIPGRDTKPRIRNSKIFKRFLGQTNQDFDARNRVVSFFLSQ